MGRSKRSDPLRDEYVIFWHSLNEEDQRDLWNILYSSDHPSLNLWDILEQEDRDRRAIAALYPSKKRNKKRKSRGRARTFEGSIGNE